MKLPTWLRRLRLQRPDALRAVCGTDHRLGDMRPGAQCPCGTARVVQNPNGSLAVRVDMLMPGHSVSGWWHEDVADLPPDHVEILVDLARSGREQDFRDMASMLGVSPDAIDGLWRGTLARIKSVP